MRPRAEGFNCDARTGASLEFTSTDAAGLKTQVYPSTGDKQRRHAAQGATPPSHRQVARLAHIQHRLGRCLLNDPSRGQELTHSGEVVRLHA